MISSSSANTASQTGGSPLLLIGLVAGFLCVVTFLPRAVLSASGMAKSQAQQSNRALAPRDARIATFARVEHLLQSGTQKDANEAGYLMDGATSAPLLISESDSAGESESEASFSSSILIAKLARQFDAMAARSMRSVTPENKKMALQWTHRARRIADSLMLSPHPSYTALKTAHYLDAVAGKREAAVFHAYGNTAEAMMSEKQNKSLKQIWHEAILPVLERTEVPTGENEKAAINTNPRFIALTETEWAAQMDYLVGLYQKERIFTSQA